MAEFGLSYGTKEEFYYRMQNFAIADATIQKINSDPSSTFTAAHNQFSTMSGIELDTYFSKSFGPQPEGWYYTSNSLMQSVDWRTSGALGPVRDEGMCGASWAIAPVTAIQAAHFISSGEILSLSE